MKSTLEYKWTTTTNQTTNLQFIFVLFLPLMFRISCNPGKSQLSKWHWIFYQQQVPSNLKTHLVYGHSGLFFPLSRNLFRSSVQLFEEIRGSSNLLMEGHTGRNCLWSSRGLIHREGVVISRREPNCSSFWMHTFDDSNSLLHSIF